MEKTVKIIEATDDQELLNEILEAVRALTDSVAELTELQNEIIEKLQNMDRW